TGLATEALIAILLSPDAETVDVMELSLTVTDRNLLASILMKDEEELTAERVEGAVRALRRIQLRRRLETIQREVQSLRNVDSAALAALLQEKTRLKRALMDPGLVETDGGRGPIENHS